jgi:hypothetical protein
MDTFVPRITSDNVTGLGSKPANLPTNVIMWKVEISLQGGIIDITYAGVATHSLVQGGAVQPIEEYLEALARGQYPQWRNPGEPVPGKTSLSIRHTDFSYFVFVLDEKNWQFMEGNTPFKVQVGKSAYYRYAQCAWIDDDENETFYFTPSPPRGKSCKVACFIADSASDQVDWGGFTGHFRTQFNFYLDVVLKRGAVPNRLLPIVIDPDVGYPGGREA